MKMFEFAVLKMDETAKIPTYATEGAAGADLYANVKEPVMILPNSRALIPTGIRMAISKGNEGQIRSRSGLANKFGVVAFPGTIDSDYRGEIGVILFNHGNAPFVVNCGDRIAQIVIAEVAQVHFGEVDKTEFEIDYATERGVGGFGSTGR